MNILRNSFDLNYITSIKNRVFSYLTDQQHKVLMVAVACLSLFSLAYLYNRYRSKGLSSKSITQINELITQPPGANATRIDIDCEEEESPVPPIETIIKSTRKKLDSTEDDTMPPEPPPALPDDPCQNFVIDTTSDEEHEESVNSTTTGDEQAHQTKTTLQTPVTDLKQEDIKAKKAASPKIEKRDPKAGNKIIGPRAPAPVAPSTPKLQRRPFGNPPPNNNQDTINNQDTLPPTPGTLLDSVRARMEKIRPSIAGKDKPNVQGARDDEWDD